MKRLRPLLFVLWAALFLAPELGARFYDPPAGRFLSPDPAGHAASWDLYSYAGGDPINHADPTGAGVQDYQKLQEAAESFQNSASVDQQADADQELWRHVDTFEAALTDFVEPFYGIQSGAINSLNENEAKADQSAIETIAAQAALAAATAGLGYIATAAVDTALASEALAAEANAAVPVETAWINGAARVPSLADMPEGIGFRYLTTQTTTQTTLDFGEAGTGGQLSQWDTAAETGAGNPLGAANMGNRVHYDMLNGGEGVELPSKLQADYPDTEFRFVRRGQSGPDVEVVGGTHPSDYQGSSWEPGNDFGDFKPDTANGNRSFTRETGNGKLPANTQMLPYDPQTGAPGW